MSENLDNFSKWFKNPLSRLHKNTDAGFIILIVSLPLLERYLREKTGNFENPTLDDKFYDEFVNLFPSVGDTKAARKFWEIYRRGLLHQATLKSPNGTVQAGLHNAAQDIQVGYDAEGSIFTVSPVKFSQKVIETIESDFPTFEAATSSRHRPAHISAETGNSGFDNRTRKP
jgi:hypothetical protein